MNVELVKEAANFFKKNKGYQRLIEQIRTKYYGLGRMGGSVSITQLTEEEREALGSLVGKDFSRIESVTIRLTDIEKALQESKFAGVGLKELLAAYFGKELATRTELIQRKQENWVQFCDRLRGEHDNLYCAKWLEWAGACETTGSRQLREAYDSNPKDTAFLCSRVCMGLSSLPETRTYKRLPVFAGEVFKDPHALDLNTELGRLFLQALAVIWDIPFSIQTEEVTELLLQFGLVRDDISNFVTCAGLLAYQQQTVHPLWATAVQMKEALQVPLRNLLYLDRVVPFDRKRDRVFVVENPAVFSAILDSLGEAPLPPMICTSGQFKMAALMVMDKLVQSGVKIWYSGDFDPEGLLMAQRLYFRYPGQIQFWRMDLESYERTMSEKSLDQTRLNKLERIVAQPLLQVKGRMLEIKRAGYQELLLKELIGDVRGKSDETKSIAVIKNHVWFRCSFS